MKLLFDANISGKADLGIGGQGMLYLTAAGETIEWTFLGDVLPLH